MAIHLQDTNTNTTIVANVTGEHWIVAEGIYVTTIGPAINALGASTWKTFHIDGHVVSDDWNAIVLGDPSDSEVGGHNQIFISSSGTMAGFRNAILSFGGNLTLTNEGMISSSAQAGILALHGYNLITNGGTITAGGRFFGDTLGSGIHVRQGNNVVANSGLISAEGDGLLGLHGENRLANTGTIVAGQDGIEATHRIESGIVIGDNIISNTGDISAGEQGIAASGGGNSVVSDGTVDAVREGILVSGGNNLVEVGGRVTSRDAEAVRLNTATGQADKLINRGVLSAEATAVQGGNGADTAINRGTINGNVVLGAGNDFFDGRGGELNSAVSGGVGNDIYIVDDPDIELLEHAGEGIDLVKAESTFGLDPNFENLELIGSGDFRAVGNSLDNTITGNIGDNDLRGRGGADTMSGGAGDDKLFGAAGNDVLSGDEGDDRLWGGADNDTLNGAEANDDLSGGRGVDVLAGGDGEDELRGGAGHDTLDGGDDDDRLFGGRGNDSLAGGEGEDWLLGGPGKDIVTGGLDADTFVFIRVFHSLPGDQRDEITDFAAAEGDVIDLSRIDADVHTGEDDGFAFIGARSFSANAGELRFTSGLLEGDVNGDRVADFQIALNVSTIGADELLL